MQKIKLPKQVKDILAKAKPVLKHHYFIFALVLLMGLVVGVYAVNQVLIMPRDQEYYLQQSNDLTDVTFDKETIEKIEALQTSGEQTAVPAPPANGRTNPFAE